MPKKDSSWIEKSGLYGTWTFTTQTMTDAGYYKAIGYVVMHLMPDPLQVKSCVITGEGDPTDKKKHKACIEADNRACSHMGVKNNALEKCVNTETSEVEWSEVNAFFQFGFRTRTGIIKKTYHEVHTSDWVGPYNIILAPIKKHTDDEEAVEGFESVNITNPLGHDQKTLFVSRYVKTPWTESQLQRPFTSSGIFNFDADILEDVVGIKAINETIHQQIDWRGTSPKTGSTADQRSLRAPNYGATDTNDDPYAKYAKTCAHGDLQPILPRLEVTKNVHPPGTPDKITFSMKVDYSMLSLPKKGVDDLYKLWPTLKSHLGPQFPLRGPYCYGKDPNRAYAIHLGYDSTANPEDSTWKAVKGCVPPWPCWRDDPKPPSLPPSSDIPEDNHSEGSYILDPKGVEAMIVYVVGFLLVISLVFNLQLANKLKKLRQTGGRNMSNSGGRGGFLYQRRSPNQSVPGAAHRQPSGNRNSTSSVPPNGYLREAAGSQSNSMEEPLLTNSQDSADRGGRTQPQEGVEESKQEAE